MPGQGIQEEAVAQARPSIPQEAAVTEPENRRKTGVDTIGMIVGLVCSVLFLAFGAWFLVCGKLAEANSTERGFFYALLIILGGPIPYFFVSSTTRIEIHGIWGKAWIAGGYAIALVATLLAIYSPPQYVWRRIAYDNNTREDPIPARRIRVVGWSSNGKVYESAPEEDDDPYSLICLFGSDDKEIKVTLEVAGIYGPERISQNMPRKGPMLEDRQLPLGSQ